MSAVAEQETTEIRMPRSVEAEAALIGAIMVANNMIDTVADMVRQEDFFEPLHGRIYGAILREHSLGRAVNPVTLKVYLDDDPALKELGGAGYLAQLTGSGASVIGVRDFARQVCDFAQRRRLIEGLQDAVRQAADMSEEGHKPIAECVSIADGAISAAADTEDGVVQMSGFHAYREMLKELDTPQTGVRNGRIKCLDEVLGPIAPHQFVIAAGRPGMGKTVLALNYAIGAAQQGHGVLFITREMSRQQLMERAAADVTFNGTWGVAYEAIRDRNWEHAEDKRRVIDSLRLFRDLPLHIVDAGALRVGRLERIVRRYKRKLAAEGKKLELVVIDYLQLLDPDGKANGQYESVSAVSRGCKSIAKTHDLGVLALAQLSRKVEERENKRPQLADLRDSGQIEQDADTVLFLYREEYYVRKTMPAEGHAKYFEAKAALDAVLGKIELIVAKRRNGVEGTAHAQFWGKFQAIRDEN